MKPTHIYILIALVAIALIYLSMRKKRTIEVKKDGATLNRPTLNRPTPKNYGYRFASGGMR